MGNWQREIPERRWAGKKRCCQLKARTSDPEKVAREFGLESTGGLEQVDAKAAAAVLEVLLWKDMAYNHEMMPRDRARELARYFIGSFPPATRFFVNARWDQRGQRPFPFHSCTPATFDGGVVAIASESEENGWLAACVWFDDED